jgi:prepilin-type N-terminal cleavage/methylation domain-containing protein
LVTPCADGRSDGGFTLIELMIAMALSTIGLIGLIALQSIAIRGNMMSRNLSEAIGIAQAQIEQAERTPYASLPALVEGACAIYHAPSAPSCTGAPSTQVAPDPHTTTQKVYTRCTAVNVDNVANVTTLQVSVCWQDGGNQPHALTMYTKRSP